MSDSDKEPLTQPIDTPKKKKTQWHIDEWLDNAVMEASRSEEMGYVHFFFMNARLPAWMKIAHYPWMKQFKLFVTYEEQRWRVTGASRLGDIWLAKNLKREDGYDKRISFDTEKLSNWSDKP